MSMTQASADYFNRVAREWDVLRNGYFGETVRAAAIAKAYLHPSMIIADVGAGAGFFTAGLALLVKQVIVLDGSPAMLTEARKNLEIYQNVECRLGDATALPLPDGCVDAAFANMYLHHCSDPLAAIKEMVRILKPGGRLVITDLDSHTHTWMQAEMADVWLGFERSELRAWFKEAGLVNVIVDCTGQSCCTTSQNSTAGDEQDPEAKINVFVAAGTRRMAMRAAVEEAYTLAAQAGCGCGTSAVDANLIAEETVTLGSACCGEQSSMQKGKTNLSISGAGCCGGSSVKTDQEKASRKKSQAVCCSGKGKALSQPAQYAGEYSAEERSLVPSEAEEISLGCGNPIAIAKLKPGEVVLDIGSGGGMDAFLAARKVGANGKVIGVDMTTAMLARARATAVKHAITNVEFRKGQAEAMPAADGEVDVVLSNCVINLCEDKGQVFREAYRVLKPGGRLEVSDVVTASALPLEARGRLKEWADCVSGALPEQEYLDLAAQAGFSGLTVQRSAAASSYVGVKVYSVIVSGRKESGQPMSESIEGGCRCAGK